MDVVLDYFKQLLNWVLSFLPHSPFSLLSASPIAQYLPWINWLCPFQFVVATGEVWLTAIALYYIYQAVLRWIRAIQ